MKNEDRPVYYVCIHAWKIIQLCASCVTKSYEISYEQFYTNVYEDNVPVKIAMGKGQNDTIPPPFF